MTRRNEPAEGTAARLEADLEARLREGVRRLGGITEKVAPTRWGMPDRLVLLPFGQVFLVELKTAVGKLRPAQVVWHERASHLRAPVVVLSGAAEIERWLGEQRFILRKKWDVEVQLAEAAEFPDDPARGGAGVARPYRVEQQQQQGGERWRVLYAYAKEERARARYAEEAAKATRPVRLTYRGNVVQSSQTD